MLFQKSSMPWFHLKGKRLFWNGNRSLFDAKGDLSFQKASSEHPVARGLPVYFLCFDLLNQGETPPLSSPLVRRRNCWAESGSSDPTIPFAPLPQVSGPVGTRS